MRGVSIAFSFTVSDIVLSNLLPYPCSVQSFAGMPLCAQWWGGSFCKLTYLSGAFMFTSRRDDALRRLGNNNNKQWLEKEGATGRLFVRPRSSRGVEEVRFAKSPDLPPRLTRSFTDVHEPPNRSPAKLNCGGPWRLCGDGDSDDGPHSQR